jgi:hypothetical protein
LAFTNDQRQLLAISYKPPAISQQKSPAPGLPGRRARFSYDDLFSYLVMNAVLTLRSKPEIETEVRICLS